MQLSSGTYRVELDLFHGPLDLLLYLVRRNEIDVTELSVYSLAAQFAEFLEIMQELNLDLAGDFVVMASTLLELKSRMVLPSEEETSEEPSTTPAAAQELKSDLVRQLLEYRKFKEAAIQLEAQSAQWQERYPRLESERPNSGKNPAADRIKEVELWDLVSALGRILRRKEVDEEASVKEEETPLQVLVEQIGDLIRTREQVYFSQLFDKETSRSRIIGMFLALLELVRHHGFRAEQLSDYGEILLRPPLPADAVAEVTTSG